MDSLFKTINTSTKAFDGGKNTRAVGKLRKIRVGENVQDGLKKRGFSHDMFA